MVFPLFFLVFTCICSLVACVSDLDDLPNPLLPTCAPIGPPYYGWDPSGTIHPERSSYQDLQQLCVGKYTSPGSPPPPPNFNCRCVGGPQRWVLACEKPAIWAHRTTDRLISYCNIFCKCPYGLDFERRRYMFYEGRGWVLEVDHSVVEKPYRLPPIDEEPFIEILGDYEYDFDPLIQIIPEPRNSDLGRNPRGAGKYEAEANRRTREVAECKTLSRSRKRKDDDKGKTCASWERLNKLGSSRETLPVSNAGWR